MLILLLFKVLMIRALAKQSTSFKGKFGLLVYTVFILLVLS